MMLNSALETPDEEDSGVQTSTFRFRHPKTKKYMLHKMITHEQKEAMNNLRRKQKKKDPQYFSKMLKQQKKKMFVNTFIKKLKNSIILSQPPPQCKSSSEQVESQQQQSIEISRKVEISISIFLFIQLIPLLLVNSLSLIFSQVLQSKFLRGYNVFGCIVHLLQMAMRLLVRHNSEEKKKKFLIENIHAYIYSQDLIIDSLVLVSFFGSMTFNITDNHLLIYICHLIIMLKIKTLLMMLGHIQLVLIENQYRQQIWNLIKVFLFNFVIAHCLAITLIAMASLNHEKNWIVGKGLDQALWYQQYVWGYYWAVTIMLTVGFGDIIPTNHQQALCMIFIETMSCIVLAYNINRVGSIISKIRSYDLQKNSNLKVFKQISQKSPIDTEIQDKITNYIKESTIIKRNSNIQEEKNFIGKLPQSFKQELLKEMNKNIWNGMIFFRNLSEKSLLQLSKHLEKKLTHPEEVVYTRGHEVDVMIFNHGTFGLAYNNGTARSNGKIIQKYFVNKNQFRVASLEFLLDNPLNYDIKCVDYMIFYKVKLKSFLSILENCPYDYEYYFMIKEKDKFLLNQFQIEKCHICQNQRHTMFKCPRLHYIPLKQHVIGRYCKGMKKKHLQNVRSKILKREKISDIASLKQMKNVKSEMIKIRLELNALQSDSEISYLDMSIEKLSDPFIGMKQPGPASVSDQGPFSYQQQKTFFDIALDQMKQGLQFKHKQYHRQTQNGVWQVECDLAHNFKFYFKQFNSQDLDFKALKKKFKNSLAA